MPTFSTQASYTTKTPGSRTGPCETRALEYGESDGVIAGARMLDDLAYRVDVLALRVEQLATRLGYVLDRDLTETAS
jgi:hypothetical protein